MSQQKHTTEFESCVQQVMDQGHEKSSAFAICTKSFQDAGKPIYVGESETQKLHLFCESFKLEGNKVSGVAIHPKRIYHPEEDMIHVYLREELKKASHTGMGKPFGIDHIYVLPPPNLLTKSWYSVEEDGIAFEGLVDDHIAEQIRKKVFKGISIELNWLRPGGSVEYVNGVAAKNFEITSVHFLKQFPPGDPDAFCKLIEAAEKKLREQAIRYGVTRTEECILDGLEGGLSTQDIANNCGTDVPVVELVKANYGYLAKKLAETKLRRAKEQLVVAPAKPVDEQLLELRQQFEVFQNAVNERLARIEGALGQVTVPPSPIGLKNPSKTRGDKMKKKLKEQNQNQEPEKDEHGCIIGKEKWDPEAEKCVAIATEQQTQESLKPLHSFLKKLKEQPEVQQCVLDGIYFGMSNEEIAEKCGVTLITVQEIRGSITGLYEALKKLREQQGNQEPEKDEHGCIIGKERYDEETEKCVAITAEARAAFLEAKLSLKEQEGELSVEEIKQKIADLTKQKQELDEKLYPESPLSEEEKTAVKAQIDTLYAEIQAYEQALATKIAGQAAPPEPPPGPGPKAVESLVSLRKKLVEVEAALTKMEKQQKRKAATWKEKYQRLHESVKGAIPPPRIWKSWTSGPQMYVQENLKILREAESES